MLAEHSAPLKPLFKLFTETGHCYQRFQNHLVPRKKRKIIIDNNCIPIIASYVGGLAADRHLESVKHQAKLRDVSVCYYFGPGKNMCYKLVDVVRYSSFYIY